MRSWARFHCVLGVVLAQSVESASAAEIEFGWSGTVTTIEAGFAAALPPGSGITVGAPVFVKYVFESTTPDLEASGTVGDYQNALVSWSLQVGDYTFTQDAGGATNEIDVVLQLGLNIYEAIESVVASPPIPGQSNLESDVFFLSLASGQLANDSLPLSQSELDPTDAGWDIAATGILAATGTLLFDVDLDAICTGACQPPFAVPVPSGVGRGLVVALCALGWLAAGRPAAPGRSRAG